MKPFPPPLLLSQFHCFCRVLVQIGAVQAVARESYFMTIEGNTTSSLVFAAACEHDIQLLLRSVSIPFFFGVFIAMCCADWLQAREDRCPAPLALGNARSRI